MRVLVTGGAGFVGSNLAVGLARAHGDWDIVVLDNLHRRGSELNLPRLREAGVAFLHGDVRVPGDLLSIDSVDAILECSAEPSALAGRAGDTEYLVASNLNGAHHCLELARRDGAQMIFLSTSRVYPFGRLDDLPFRETDTRFELDADDVAGISAGQVTESFPLEGARTLYGATKLAAEHLITEYAESFGVRTVVNRCGVIAGPWQMGKVDQGVFTYWVLAHYFKRPLSYIGYGGLGKQVRDLLHVSDLLRLIEEQLRGPEAWAGAVVNVGGGREVSLSLRETTELCRELTGHIVEVAAAEESRPGDVRVYLSGSSHLASHTDWRPEFDARSILADTLEWVAANERAVRIAL